MSKMEVISGNTTPESQFGANYDRLEAVESVVSIVSDMADTGPQSSLDLPHKEQMQFFYLSGSPMLQRQIDSICDDMAVTARSGTRALLQFKSEGRNNLEAAAGCLMREINQMSGQIVALMRR
ncbi:MAG: hypothetical protein ABJN65_12445 [Parasphingorhabdus sp.]